MECWNKKVHIPSYQFQPQRYRLSVYTLYLLARTIRIVRLKRAIARIIASEKLFGNYSYIYMVNRP